MRKTSLAIAISMVCAASPAFAQGPDAKPQSPPARFSFNRVDDGFLRLDKVSGQVTFCSLHGAAWACQAVPEDRAALEKEIARLNDKVVALRDQVVSLKNEVAVLREPPPPPRPPADLTPRTGKSDDAMQLRKDIERARAAVENAWRRLVDMIVNFQQDMMRKG